MRRMVGVAISLVIQNEDTEKKEKKIIVFMLFNNLRQNKNTFWK